MTYEIGFAATPLQQVLDHPAAHLWGEKRRRREYVSQVLARGALVALLVQRLHPQPRHIPARAGGLDNARRALAFDWIEHGKGGRWLPHEPEERGMSLLRKTLAPCRRRS